MAKSSETTTQQFKDLPAVALKADGDGAGTVEAIVAVFSNTDNGNERIMPGAFAESLKNKLPRMVWAHEWSKIIGKSLEAEELMPGDARLPASIRGLGGLRVLAKMFLNTTDGRNAYEVIKELGDQMEFSIGYTVPKGGDRIAKDGVRELLKVNLMEFSPVLSGMNPATALLAVKTAEASAEAVKDAAADDAEKAPQDAPIDPDAPQEEEAQATETEEVAAAFATFREQVASTEDNPDHIAALNILVEGLETAVTSAMERAHAEPTDEAPADDATLASASEGDEKAITEAELKAGRVLSSKNFDKLATAHAQLGEVLAAARARTDDEGKSDTTQISTTTNNDGNTKADSEANKSKELKQASTTDASVASETAGSDAGTKAVDERKSLELEARITALTEEVKVQMVRTKALKVRLGIHD